MRAFLLPQMAAACLAAACVPATSGTLVEPVAAERTISTGDGSASASDQGSAHDEFHVVMSASRAFALCAQRATDRAICVSRTLEGEFEQTVVETDGWLARCAPFVAYVHGNELVHVDGLGSHRLPFAPREMAALTLGVTCARGDDGRIACDSFESPNDFRPVSVDAAPLVAATIVASWDTLLAIDPSNRLFCIGRACNRLFAQRAALERGEVDEPSIDLDDPSGSLATGTPWPVGHEIPEAMLLATGVLRVWTDGLGRACIADRSHRVACHEARGTVVYDGAGALDHATAAIDDCVLVGSGGTARVTCRFVDSDGEATTVLDALVPGARRLHAQGTTLCVEHERGLACTELRGISVAPDLVEVISGAL